MRRSAFTCFALALSSASLTHVGNPEDIRFEVRLTKETRAFHIGERIELEFAYSTSSPNKYRLSTSSQPSIDFSFMPALGVVDLEAIRWERGWGGSIIGSFGVLDSKPSARPIELTNYYRLLRPGHYALAVISHEVSRIKAAEEGGGHEPVPLESLLEFDVIPLDAAWSASELNRLEQVLRAHDDPANPGTRSRAIADLALLDTPEAVRLLLQFYLATADTGDWQFTSALRESSQHNVIIPALRAALSDPAADIPSTLPELLAGLQTRQELGPPERYKPETANQPDWSAKVKERSEAHDRYLEQALALLTASIPKRVGHHRAQAVYQAWMDAEFLNHTKPVSAKSLSNLRAEVLAQIKELDYPRRLNFVSFAWHTLPHDQLLPLLPSLAKGDGSPNSDYQRLEAYRYWCEDAPEDCHTAILSEIRESNGQTNRNIVFLLPASEHPEFDAMLQAGLDEVANGHDYMQTQRITALVLRLGSHKLAPSVDSLLDKFGSQGACIGDAEGFLLGYEFRITPQKARTRLASLLWDLTSACGAESLRTLHNVSYSEDVLPVVTKALDSPNLRSVLEAALFLGYHASESSEPLLWRRMESFWAVWKDRAAELNVEAAGNPVQVQAANLEQALASALAHAKNWKLDSAETERLRSGCLTEGCREIAAGQRSLGM